MLGTHVKAIEVLSVNIGQGMLSLCSLSVSLVSSRKELINLSGTLSFVTAGQRTGPDYQPLGASRAKTSDRTVYFAFFNKVIARESHVHSL